MGRKTWSLNNNVTDEVAYGQANRTGNVLYPDLKDKDGTISTIYSPASEEKPEVEPEVRDDVGPQRMEWGSRPEFILACIGNAVGLGNLWRFPYLCYESGGGAFLIPYFIMLILCGIPLLYMEYAVGQYTRQGPIGALKKMSPFFQGAAMATVMLSFLLCTYYNVIMSWALFYLGSSFQKELPWATCNHGWTSPECYDGKLNNSSPSNDSISPTQDFFEQRVLKQSDGLEDFGTIQWEILLLLILSWVVVYLALWKGIKITGKVVYFTALFPYIIIFIMLGRGLTLEGNQLGVDYFTKPKWHLLKEPKVWVNAAAQNFNSIGIAFGSMITYASYKRRDSHIFRDVLMVTLTNSATSILCGFAIFSTLGHIAFVQGKDVDSVVTEGPGLVFMVFPQAFVTMPVPQLFSVLFFVMLLCMAIDSQFANVEVVVTSIEDSMSVSLRKKIRKEVLVLIVCVVAFVLGLPNVFNGGIFFFQIIDKYSSGISLMLVAIFEVIAVVWFYGGRRLARNVRELTGTGVWVGFVVCWYIISPALIIIIMIFNWVDYTPVSYGAYTYPGWAEGLGWALAALSLICIPMGMIKSVVEAEGSNICQKFLSSIKSQDHLLEDPNTNITLTMSAVHADYTVKDVKEGHV